MKLLVGLVAFVMLSTCIGVLPNAVPDLEGNDGASTPVSGPDPSDVPATVRPFRLLRDGPADGGPAGWFRYVAADGSFSAIGPGRPDQRDTRRGSVSTFRSSGIELVVEVAVSRNLQAAPARARLERSSAFLLHDLGAIEQARRWTREGDVVVLDVEARGAEMKFRIRSFVAERRQLTAWASWTGTLAAADADAVSSFLAGVRVGTAP